MDTKPAESKAQEKYELKGMSKEETQKVQSEIDEVLKRNGAEIVITNTVQVFKRVKVEEGVPTPSEFMPVDNGAGEKKAD